MAQPSVAREPSMEEILASIRRIIESNEPDAAQSAETVAAPAESGNASVQLEVSQPAVDELTDHFASAEPEENDDDIHLTVEDSFEDAADEPVTEAEAPKPQVLQQNTAQFDARPTSLADVAARVRSHAETSKIETEQPASSPLVTSRMQGLAAGGAEAKPIQAGTVVVPAKQQEPDTSKEASPSSQVVVKAQEKPQNIVSETTQSKVARSFDELAAALSAEPQRSLDEIAEEMLRPMLREWLDDNLPSMVERLVREEIERVARGPRS